VGNPVLQRLALQQLHADEGLALVLVDVVDRADIGVVEGRRGPGLALEALGTRRFSSSNQLSTTCSSAGAAVGSVVSTLFIIRNRLPSGDTS